MGKNVIKGLYGSVPYNNGKLDVINVNLINSVTQKAFKNISKRSLEDIYTISFKGHKFNVLPFLLNGSAYYPEKYRSDLCATISSNELQLKYFKREELENVDLLDLAMMDCLVTSYNDNGIRDLGAFLHYKKPYDLALLLFNYMYDALKDIVIDMDKPHFDFKFNSICNTQAFTYYIGVEWLLHNVPELKPLIQRQLRQFGYKDIMYSLCPDDCIHMRYIKGEINSTELKRLYHREHYSDGSSISQREMMCLATDGKYDGRDLSNLEIGLSSDLFGLCTGNKEYKLNLHLSYCMFFNGTYESLSNQVDVEVAKCKQAYEDRDEALQRMRLAMDSAVELKQTIKEQEKLIVELKSKLANTHTNSELEDRIRELESKVKSLEGDNTKLFNERILLKQTISSQKKKLRNLDQSSDEDDIDKAVKDFIGVSEFDLDNAVSLLKDKSYIIIGADGVKSIDLKFEELGFTNVKRFKKSMRTLGNCDCVIIFTQLCHHDDVYRCESMAGNNSKTEFVYANNQNMEMVIKTLYENLI